MHETVIWYTHNVRMQLRRMRKKNPEDVALIINTLKLMRNAIKSPSLGTKKYCDMQEGNKHVGVFESHAKNAISGYRILWCYSGSSWTVTVLHIAAYQIPINLAG